MTTRDAEMKREFILSILLIVGVTAFANRLTGADVADDSDNLSVLTVDGHSVHLDEFTWFMHRERAAVFRKVSADFSLNSETNFWDQDCNGVTPREILLEKTVESVVREKAEQLLFKELGLVDDIQHSVFLERLEKLNAQRQKAVEAGKVIYGPVQYSARQYYSHWMATMKIKAKDQLRKEQPELEETQLRNYYAQKKDQYRSPDCWTVDVLMMKELVGNRAQGQGMKAVAEEIVLKVGQEREMETISLDYKESEEVQVTFSHLEKMDEDRLGEWFMEESLSLKPGQVIRLPKSKGEIWIAKVISFFPSDYMPFEQIRDHLKSGCLDDAYEKMIRKRVRDAHIEINQQIMNEIETL